MSYLLMSLVTLSLIMLACSSIALALQLWPSWVATLSIIAALVIGYFSATRLERVENEMHV